MKTSVFMVWTCLCAGLLAAAVTGMVQAEDQDGVFLQNRIHDFGKVRAGEKIRVEFVIENRSTKTVEIVEVKPSCGCTSTGKWDRTIAPGKLGRVPVVLDTKGMHGSIHKTVHIRLKDAPLDMLIATLSGSSFLGVEVQPSFLRFPAMRDKNLVQTLRAEIISNLDEPVNLRLPDKPGTFRLQLKSLEKGKRYELTVRTPEKPVEGWNRETLHLATGVAGYPDVEVPVYCYVYKPLECRPGVLTLPPGKLTREIIKVTIFSINLPGAFKPPEVRHALPGADVQVEPSGRENEYRIAAHFPRGFALAGETSAALVITVEDLDGQRHTLELPVEQIKAEP